MAKYVYNDYRNVEIRKLNADVLCDLIDILEVDNDWKRLMSLVPKNIESLHFEPKYNSEHIRLIEDHAKSTNQKCTEIMFDEWGTSGRVRPTLNTLKRIVIQAQMFRAADEIARLLKEPYPMRPEIGPAAPVTGLTMMLNDESSIRMDSRVCNDPTKEMKSASDMIKFSESMNIPNLSVLIGDDTSFNEVEDSQKYSSRGSNDQYNGFQYQTSFPNINISGEIDSVILKDVNLKHFQYDDLRQITNNFCETPTNVPHLTGKIGSGGFGEVYVGKHLQYGLLAIKKIKNNLPMNTKSDIAMTLFNTEVRCLSQFKHKNIVPIFGFSIDGPAPCVVCEYIDGGSLHYNIAAKILNKEQRFSIIAGTAEGLKYLHAEHIIEDNSSNSENLPKSVKNFVHGDIKSANILLTRDCVPKLCDFGLSKQHDATTFITTPQGTESYMAHEMLHGTITQKGDIYSFGIVLLELLTGFEPIVKRDGVRYNIKDYVEENVTNNDISMLVDPVVGEWPKAKEIYELCQMCLQYDRKSRPTINEVCDTLDAMQ
ncbi:interleukin-1 receptor-associated kinase 4-like [Aricia agestis]|uniref:interleukin-1 receptor-associated kinase 4-like n=1 Tax=Aricia agestis TaxID=91739 RepID=UPI001C2074AB|nr:interleukin-1 receptor-associated kinase 4-like [Aricia agestis]